VSLEVEDDVSSGPAEAEAVDKGPKSWALKRVAGSMGCKNSVADGEAADLDKEAADILPIEYADDNRKEAGHNQDKTEEVAEVRSTIEQIEQESSG